MLDGKINPCEAVFVFVDAEGNDIAFAAAAGALVNQKDVSAKCKASMDAAA